MQGVYAVDDKAITQGLNNILAVFKQKCAFQSLEEFNNFFDDFQRAVKEVNSGAYWFNVDSLLSALDKLVPSEKTGEYYLTDTVQIIKQTDKTVSAFKAASSDSVLGANDCSQLAQLNEIARNRVIEKHLANGVNIPCRDGVMIGCDVKIEAGATILPASVKGRKCNRPCGLH